MRRKRSTGSSRATWTAWKVQKRSSTVSAGQTDAHCDRERARGNPGEFEPSIGAIRWAVVAASGSGIPEPGSSRQVSPSGGVRRRQSGRSGKHLVSAGSRQPGAVSAGRPWRGTKPMGATGGFLQQWRETQRTRQWSKALELAVTKEAGRRVMLGNEQHR